MEKIFVTRPFLPDKDVFKKYIDDIWESQWLTNQGPLHERFAEELKKSLGFPNVTLTVNGHMALEIALKGLGITGEVITTPFTFASTIHALTLCNIKPVFCDIKPDDFTMDTDRIEELITDKTTAIMPVHVYGHMCDTEKIELIANRNNLKVIYDAAHAFGVKKNGLSAGVFGDVSMFSFHATKLFNTIEGGALVYKNCEYESLFNAYKNFGIEGEETVSHVGGNAKMNEFQAAMGLANLPYMDVIVEERKRLTLRYREFLKDIEGIRFFIPEEKKGIEYNYSYFPVQIDNQVATCSRDEVHLKLKEDNIFTRKYFYPIATDYECYKSYKASSNVPVAEAAGNSVMTLPLYYDMGIDKVDYVCEKIAKAMK